MCLSVVGKISHYRATSAPRAVLWNSIFVRSRAVLDLDVTAFSGTLL